MKYEVISGPIALEGDLIAQNGDVIILGEADGKALVQYQILKVAAEDAIAINDPNPVPEETAAQKKKRLAEEEAAAKAVAEAEATKKAADAEAVKAAAAAAEAAKKAAA